MLRYALTPTGRCGDGGFKLRRSDPQRDRVGEHPEGVQKTGRDPAAASVLPVRAQKPTDGGRRAHPHRGPACVLRSSSRGRARGQGAVAAAATGNIEQQEGGGVMIAAIYARKSTEQNGVGDEEKSVTRQIEHAKAYAARKGWLVDDDHVYVDDGISGAEFIKRPGFIRLMNALSPRPPFQVLVMSEESRLGREQIETAYALKQITDAGVRVFFYLEERERTLDNAMDKVMLSLTNFASEMEREKARQRTYDAMLRKAKALHVTGGKVYGYDNVEVLGTDGTRQSVTRRANPKQAAIIGRIFELYASGVGMLTIAHRLNNEGVKPPRGRGWAPSAVREMLYRPLYRGEVVWNRSQKIVKGGTKKQRRRDQSEWLTFAAPGLRIVADELWQRVKARLAERATAFPRIGRKFAGRPRYQDESAYLLVGFARCATCGGPVGTDIRAHGSNGARRPIPYYACLDHKRRGESICANKVALRQDILDRAILHAIAEALHPDVLAR